MHASFVVYLQLQSPNMSILNTSASFRVGDIIHFKIIYIDEECVNLCSVRHELVMFPFSISIVHSLAGTNASTNVLLDMK